MKTLVGLGLLGVLSGCTLNLFTPGSDKTVPEFDNTATQDIVIQEWVSGFVPVEMAKREILSINGIGNWRVERQPLNLPTVSLTTVATGSLTIPQLQALLERAYRPVSSTNQSFINLPAQLPSQITDVPLRSITLNLKSRTIKVEDPGSGNEAFQEYYGAIASTTIALPLND